MTPNYIQKTIRLPLNIRLELGVTLARFGKHVSIILFKSERVVASGVVSELWNGWRFSVNVSKREQRNGI